MKRTGHVKLVGLVIGKILNNASPLVYSLYMDESHRPYHAIVEFKHFQETQRVVDSFVKTLGDKIIARYTNGYKPYWHYIQLATFYGPYDLRRFALPVAVFYEPWTKHGLQ